MGIFGILLTVNLVLVIGATPQDFSDLFSVYAANLNTSTSGRQYYDIQLPMNVSQLTSGQLNATEGNVDFDETDNDNNNFEGGDDDEMDYFFYENGFVEIGHDGVYDYSYKPVKLADGSLVNTTLLQSGLNSDEDAKLEGEIQEQIPDNEEDGIDVDHSLTTQRPLSMPTEEANVSTTTPESITKQPESNGTMEGLFDLEHETNFDYSMSTEEPDQIIPAFVHPIYRPSSQWPLNQTQVVSPTKRKPVRRRRPQNNKRPQQGGGPQKIYRRRRRCKRQKCKRKPINALNNIKKRKRIPGRRPLRKGPNKFFGSCGACQCGVTTTRRIVGGTIAAVNEFPWLALIAYQGTIQCGGTLINDRYVLTAAHCVRGFKIEQFQIRFLEYNRATTSDTTLVIRRAARIYTLNSYRASSANNDIGIIKLSSPIAFASTTVRPICLPLPGTDFTGSTGTIAGWGATKEGGDVSKILRKAKVPIISNTQCRLIGMKITSNMLCAGRILQGGIDACQGDSGGPLMVVRNKRYYLAGIVSWGDGCARPNKPGVYTRATQYISWIKQVTSGSCSCF